MSAAKGGSCRRELGNGSYRTVIRCIYLAGQVRHYSATVAQAIGTGGYILVRSTGSNDRDIIVYNIYVEGTRIGIARIVGNGKLNRRCPQWEGGAAVQALRQAQGIARAVVGTERRSISYDYRTLILGRVYRNVILRAGDHRHDRVFNHNGEATACRIALSVRYGIGFRVSTSMLVIVRVTAQSATQASHCTRAVVRTYRRCIGYRHATWAGRDYRSGTAKHAAIGTHYDIVRTCDLRKVVIFYRYGEAAVYTAAARIGILVFYVCRAYREGSAAGQAMHQDTGLAAAATVVAERRSVIVNDCATLVNIIVNCDIGRTAFYHRRFVVFNGNGSYAACPVAGAVHNAEDDVVVAQGITVEGQLPDDERPVLEHQVGNLAVVIAAAVYIFRQDSNRAAGIQLDSDVLAYRRG